MNSLTVSASYVAEGKPARIVASQNAFFSLIEHKVERLAVEAPQLGFKHQKVERP
jgi:hypothetical protein